MLRATIPILLAAATPFGAPPPAGENTADENVTATIDAGATAAPISPYIYGQFIEHIGDLINRSMWAEMLDDRKFYNEINSKPPSRSRCAAGRPTCGGPSARTSPW